MQIFKSMKEILKECKEFEHSFDVKLAICSVLLITYDRHPRQEEALKTLNNILKYLLNFIIEVDVRYGNAKPPSSGTSH